MPTVRDIIDDVKAALDQEPIPSETAQLRARVVDLEQRVEQIEVEMSAVMRALEKS